MDKKKSIAIISVFAAMIFGLFVWQLILPDAATSKSERRKLTQLPEISVKAMLSGGFSKDLEDYLLDQFPQRDAFRTLKAVARMSVLRQRDNNGIYLVGDSIFKLDYPLKDDQVLFAAQKLNSIRADYLDGCNVYYSVIPDKNYFAAAQNGYPCVDYDLLFKLLGDNVEGMQYIDITDCLSLSDYYRTDTHWRQECILPVAQRLAQKMGAGMITPKEAYTEHTLAPFSGVYLGQSALPVPTDSITYLTSPATDGATVTSIEADGIQHVYTLDKFSGMDSYDIFLSGAAALQVIEMKDAGNGRELILFRDSFASSIAPLLLGAYSKITLVDLRYFSSKLLGEHVDFDGADVLFLYSTGLINSAMLLK
ncbi:MAG: DHHW family protein [Clostridia bacterium]